MSNHRARRRLLPALGICAGVVAGAIGVAHASSHREAPLSSQDPVSDLTDVYAFVSPDAPDTVTLIANVIPFEQPAGGPNFYRFGDDVLYQINVDNDGDARADRTLPIPIHDDHHQSRTRSSTTPVRSPASVMPISTCARRTRSPKSTTAAARGCSDATCRSRRPTSASARRRTTSRTSAALRSSSLGGGITAFAGPRDDAFFVDLGSVFDLAGLPPFNPAHVIPLPAATGEDYVAGLNVHTLALQVPIDRLVDGDPVLGVWATTYRKAVRIADDDGSLKSVGKWVQVSRLGQPLVNEVVIPVGKKDHFNASQPSQDVQFLDEVITPELAGLIPVLYPGVQVPATVDAGLGLGGREDLATIFLTGIPGLNQPAHVQPSEMLRINTSIPQSGFPNGRTLDR